MPRRSSSSWSEERGDRRKPRRFRSYSKSFSGPSGPSEGSARPAPVEEGKEYDVVVESIGSKGDGIAKLSGFIIFVPNGKVGDRVKVRINAVRRNFAIGEIVKTEAAIAPELPVTEETEEEKEIGEEAPELPVTEETEEEKEIGEETKEDEEEGAL